MKPTKTDAPRPRKLVLVPSTVRVLTAKPNAAEGQQRATIFDPRASRITCTR